MSQMEDFFRQAAENEEIREELSPILDGKSENEITMNVIENVMQIAERHGFNLLETNVELSDDDLDQVSGGNNTFTTACANFAARCKAGYKAFLTEPIR